MYFQIFRRGIYWYWHLKGANHEIIANGEGYVAREGAEYAVGLVISTNAATPVYRDAA